MQRESTKFWIGSREQRPGQQSRVGSFVEALANVAIGYGIALASQLVILPAYGVHVSMRANIEIGLWFTAVSICRSYCLRRWFNRKGGITLRAMRRFR